MYQVDANSGAVIEGAPSAGDAGGSNAVAPAAREAATTRSADGDERVEKDAVDAHELASEFLRNDYGRVLATVAWCCGPRSDPTEFVAEALVRLLEQAQKRRTIENVPAWITQTAINLGRSDLRRLAIRRRKLPLLWSLDSLPAADARPDILDVRDAVARLPKRQAQVIGLYYGLDMSVSDIAELLSLSEGGVKASLAKARRALQERLGVDEETASDE